MSLVLDASVALAWCFEDELTPEVMDLLDLVADAGGMAPLLWPLEALNGLFAAERRRRIGAEKRATLAGFLRALPITLDADTAERAWDATAPLAAQFQLTVYDAAYLELAPEATPAARISRPGPQESGKRRRRGGPRRRP